MNNRIKITNMILEKWVNYVTSQIKEMFLVETLFSILIEQYFREKKSFYYFKLNAQRIILTNVSWITCFQFLLFKFASYGDC